MNKKNKITPVSEAIKDQQNLITAKNRLDDELRRLKLIQKYSQEALNIKDKKAFGELTVEYFIEIFNQARGVLFEYDSLCQTVQHLGIFGLSCNEIKTDNKIVGEMIRTLPHNCNFLNNSRKFKKQFDFLNLVDGYVCPIFCDNKVVNGLVIIGYTSEDALYYPGLNSENLNAFTSLAHSVGILLRNLNFQIKLKQELHDTQDQKDELAVNTQKLSAANLGLEEKISHRSKSLIKANKLLKQEIEEKKKIELRLRNQAEALKRSNEDLSQFASVISHDLKSPLRSIIAFSELLDRNYSDNLDAKGLEYLNFIVNGAKNFSEIINDLLEFSKVSKIKSDKKKIDTNLLLNKVLKSLYVELETKGGIVNVSSLPVIRGDSFQLESLFQNLIENGLKFNNKKQPTVSIDCKNMDDHYLFSVSDNGIGIEPQFHDKVFVLFERLHAQDKYMGTGLGLSISKKIVERHHGKIWIDSKVNDGTTFYFTIPH